MSFEMIVSKLYSISHPNNNNKNICVRFERSKICDVFFLSKIILNDTQGKEDTQIGTNLVVYFYFKNVGNSIHPLTFRCLDDVDSNIIRCNNTVFYLDVKGGAFD